MIPFVASVVGDVLAQRGEWFPIELGEPLELAHHQDSDRRLILRNGPFGARGQVATRAEFPLFFELLDLQALLASRPGNEQRLEAEHFDRIDAFIRDALRAARH
jgi:hypothetical protein